MSPMYCRSNPKKITSEMPARVSNMIESMYAVYTQVNTEVNKNEIKKMFDNGKSKYEIAIKIKNS